jgi:O-antigen ligase
MMKSGVCGKKSPGLLRNASMSSKWETLSLSSLFPLAAVMMAFLIGGVLGVFGPYIGVAILGGIVIAIIIILRQDELAATIVIGVHLYLDWYLFLHLVGLLLVLSLLLIFFFNRSAQHPWIKPRALWLWIFYLLITIEPALRGILSTYDAATYYPSTIFGAFIFFWLGTVIARDGASVRRCFQLFAGFGTLIALHTIIQTTTGIILLESANAVSVIASMSNYQIFGTNAFRAGSLFIDPNWNGVFLAMMFFLPFGLFVESSSLLKKAWYLAEMALILLALLFTYSNGAWVGFFVGVLAFIVFVGRNRYRVLLPVLIFVALLFLATLFPSQIASQLMHASAANELSLRIGAWQTAIGVIEAFPLTGVGLGYQHYLLAAEPYRVQAQIVPLQHPHNSYLELGAMGGLPVLLIFMTLLGFAFWVAIRNWARAVVSIRPIIGGGIAAIVALSAGSLSTNGWTHLAMGGVGWLILGVISSPLLAKNPDREILLEKAVP